MIPFHAGKAATQRKTDKYGVDVKSVENSRTETVQGKGVEQNITKQIEQKKTAEERRTRKE